jgi:ribosome modulation factor
VTNGNSKFWDAGYKAGYAGTHRSACPYPSSSAPGTQWLNGWAFGMQQWLIDHPAPKPSFSERNFIAGDRI